MKTPDFEPRQTVTYVPPHPGKIEHGIVSSITDKFVFVKFYPQLDNLERNSESSLSPRTPTA